MDKVQPCRCDCLKLVVQVVVERCHVVVKVSVPSVVLHLRRAVVSKVDLVDHVDRRAQRVAHHEPFQSLPAKCRQLLFFSSSASSIFLS